MKYFPLLLATALAFFSCKKEDTGDDFDIAKEGINRLSQFFINDLKLASSLSAINISDEHFKKMAHKATKGKEIKGLVSLNANDIEGAMTNVLEALKEVYRVESVSV